MKHIIKRTLASWVLPAAAFLFLFISCSKEDGNSNNSSNTGSAALQVTVGDLTEPDDTATLERGAVQSETVEASFNGEYTMECTMERTPVSSTRTATALATGTYYRLIAYHGTSASDVTTANYAGNAVFKVGSESATTFLLEAGSYYFVAYSYNETTDNISGDGFDGASTTSIPVSGTVSPPTDVLWFGKAATLVDGDNALSINFKHVFSQVQVVLDIAEVGTNLNASAAVLTPGKNATVPLATGTAAAGTTSVTQNITWTAPSGTSYTSNKTIVYTAGSTPTITFPVGAINLTRSTGTVSNTSAIAFSFGNSLQAGYTYTLTCTMKATGNLNVVVLATGNYYGYAISYSEGGAYKVINNTTNFGPASNYSLVDGFTFITNTSISSTTAENTNTYKWITGIGNDGKIADIVYIAYQAWVNGTVAANSTYLKEYLQKGGVILAYIDNLGGYYQVIQSLLQTIYNDSSIGYVSTGLGGGSIYGFPAQGLSDPSLTTVKNTYADDLIVNGPFGDIRDKQWGEDASYTTSYSNIPTTDANTTIYSYARDISTTSPGTSTNVTAFKYESDTYNLVFFGDGGFMSSEGTGSNSTSQIICPFYYNSSQFPIAKPDYGWSINKFSVYNSIAFCNAMAWGIKRSISLKGTRNSNTSTTTTP